MIHLILHRLINCRYTRRGNRRILIDGYLKSYIENAAILWVMLACLYIRPGIWVKIAGIEPEFQIDR